MVTMIEWIMTHTPDDAFLYLQLVTGRTSILETNGYQPLWALVLAPFGALIEGETLMYVVIALYYLVLLAIPFVVHRLYHTWWGLLLWCIPALIVGNIMMELTLAILVIFIAVRYRKPETSILMVYARLDLLPLALIITPIRKWWKLALYYSPWLIFQLVVFQTIIPDTLRHMDYSTSGLVGGGISLSWPLTGYQLFLFTSLEAHYTLPFLIVGIIGCAISSKYRPLLYQFAFLIVADLIRGFPQFMWHYTVVPVIIVLGTKELCEYLSLKINWSALKILNGKRLVASFLLIPAILAIPSISNQVIYPMWSWQPAMYESKDIVVDGTRGALNSGIQGFFSSQKVYNLDGYFCHDVTVVDYITDYEPFIPDGYELVTIYKETAMGPFGLYKRIE